MKRELDSGKLPVLVVEDNREAVCIEALFIDGKYLKNTPFQVIPATDLREARQGLRDFRPAAVVLDVLLQEERSWGLLEELKPTFLRSIPVLVVAVEGNREKALALGADGFCEKPVDRVWLLRQLESTAERQLGPQVLIIDGDEASRDLIKAVLAQGECRVLEAAGGNEGLRKASEDKPDVVVLDLAMPDLSRFEVQRRLEQNPQTAAIPVILHTSKILDSPERSRLSSAVDTISEEAASRELSLAHFTDALGKAGFAFPARPGNEATHV
jgi:CheY-like chemotaxis protein